MPVHCDVRQVYMLRPLHSRPVRVLSPTYADPQAKRRTITLRGLFTMEFLHQIKCCYLMSLYPLGSINFQDQPSHICYRCKRKEEEAVWRRGLKLTPVMRLPTEKAVLVFSPPAPTYCSYHHRSHQRNSFSGTSKCIPKAQSNKSGVTSECHISLSKQAVFLGQLSIS